MFLATLVSPSTLTAATSKEISGRFSSRGQTKPCATGAAPPNKERFIISIACSGRSSPVDEGDHYASQGSKPDGKKAVEFESELIGREFIDRMVNFDLSEDDIRKRIDRLAVSADVKSLLYSLAKASIAIGAQVVRIGRKVIDYVCMLVKEFPKVTFFALLGAIAGFLVATIPILGVVLGPIVTPIAIAVGAAFGVLEDIRDQALKRKITEFHAQFAPLA